MCSTDWPRLGAHYSSAPSAPTIPSLPAHLPGQTAAGIEPGVHVSIKSSAELVHATLAYSAAAALLGAYADWTALRAAREGGSAAGADARRALLASVDGGTMKAG